MLNFLCKIHALAISCTAAPPTTSRFYYLDQQQLNQITECQQIVAILVDNCRGIAWVGH